MNISRILLTSWIAGLCLLASPGSLMADPQLGHPRLDRHVERPDAQAAQPYSLSSLQRSVWLPEPNNRVKFTYEVDSEPGDQLRLYADGQLVWQAGGRLLRGRAEVSVCPGAGLCTLDFQYRKNGFTDGGQDTARIDDLALRSGNQLIETFFFDEASPGVPAGWTTSGYGGWEARAPAPPRAVMRPPAQAYTGGGSSASWMERVITWPQTQANFLDFTYFVDSADGDVLRVRIDGSAVFEVGGANRAGRELLPVSTGTHVVRFEYDKTGAAEEGLDTARVTEIVALSGGKAVEAHDFRGQTLDVASADWQVGGFGGGWVVTNASPPRTYVPQQTVGQKLDPSWKTFDEPILDGFLDGDYDNATELRLFNYGDAAALPARLALVASTSESLYLSWRAPAVTTALGDEEGSVGLYLDADRDLTLLDQGCQGDRHVANEADRRFVFDYKSGSGSGVPSIQSWSQEVGNCAGSFDPIDREDPWSLDVEIREPVDDVGFVHFEMVLRPPAGQSFGRNLGLALVHETTGGSVPSLLRFPFRDGDGPLADDVHTWETVVFVLPVGEVPGSEVPGDGVCCYPKPGLPGVMQ